MIETVAATADIARPSLTDVRGWMRLGKRATTEYRPTERLPEGIGYLGLIETPDGWQVRWEGNLTAVLHGSRVTAGSLARSEVTAATDRALALVNGVCSAAPEPGWRWDVTRFDPSGSWVMPEGTWTQDVVKAAHVRWLEARTGNQRVGFDVSTGATATWVKSKRARSWSVYDKTAEARLRHKVAPPGVIRLEARLRPKRGTWHLGQTEDLMESSERELEALARTVGEALPSAVRLMVAALMRGQEALGEKPDPGEAFRLASVGMMVEDEGVKSLEAAGVPRRTAYRWRSRVTQLLEAGGGMDGFARSAAELFDPQQVLLARDLVERD